MVYGPEGKRFESVGSGVNSGGPDPIDLGDNRYSFTFLSNFLTW